MKAGKILLGILSGAAAGAAVGILFAPKKGTDTRRRIADKSNEYMYDTKSKFNDLADNLSHRYDSVKTKVRGKSKKMQARMDGDDKIIY
ncbi:YtxH domain-containing protein [Salinimicrobium flavum]|uniref:YtxH domain-containing protein n=1 Tax=Salinimicrobium flavum TaxID=1737065 RepID=A0ABW5J044_9FLAO